MRAQLPRRRQPGEHPGHGHRRRGRAQDFGTLRGEAGRVRDRDAPGPGQRRDLAQAVACRGSRLDAEPLQARQRGQRRARGRAVRGRRVCQAGKQQGDPARRALRHVDSGFGVRRGERPAAGYLRGPPRPRRELNGIVGDDRGAGRAARRGDVSGELAGEVAQVSGGQPAGHDRDCVQRRRQVLAVRAAQRDHGRIVAGLGRGPPDGRRCRF
jgi:hypothetical protein